MKTAVLCIASACLLAACASVHHEPRPPHVSTLHSEHVVGRYVIVHGRHHVIGCGNWGDLYDVDDPSALDALVRSNMPEPYVAVDGMVEDKRSSFDHEMRPSIAVVSATALASPPAGCTITPTPPFVVPTASTPSPALGR
ncbi:hypothetical protein [Lysobacter claricitrinus]|uniref:hypothetical protein n=1 Tax=Lysobacter claricitrinus TaxID=3367728 RepID=UPI0037DBCA8D